MEEAFAHAYAFGSPPLVALRQAGYETPSMVLFAALMRKTNVEAIIQADRSWYQNKMAASKEALAMQLDTDRDFAYASGNPGAAVAATMGKAKIHGFMDAGGAGRVPSRIVIEWGDDSTETIHETGSIVQEDPADD